MILDSRPVHTALPTSPALRTAKQQNNMPVHATVTAGPAHLCILWMPTTPDDNVTLFQPWPDRLPQWQQWVMPFLFIHTPYIVFLHRR
ncbi:hypothetical protein [Sodalis-like endosymbiont of Proechinophthirus fluctus]|uniref:hypothetical protein n=1 Tax=Sodalis-like endosymbiont of Proechinophthirus fluctus TaxID=1462730 RepID=UPI00082BB40F|nr:hypothetical protein [Sodalis-like endosymbiont of Proechinophthirus fluctus]